VGYSAYTCGRTTRKKKSRSCAAPIPKVALRHIPRIGLSCSVLRLWQLKRAPFRVSFCDA